MTPPWLALALAIGVTCTMIACACEVASRHGMTVRVQTFRTLFPMCLGITAETVLAAQRAGAASVLMEICVASAVLVCAITDAQTGYVFDAITLPVLLIVFVLSACSGVLPFALAGTLVSGGSLAVLYAVSFGRGLGFGDVKLAASIGAFMGARDGLACLGVAFVAGGVYAATLLLRGRARCGQAICFAPYLACAMFAVLFYEVFA